MLHACSNSNGEKSHLKFSPDEIASLELDSTQFIKLRVDSVQTFDLNPYLKKNDLNFGEMIKSIKFLPLETNDENLISEIAHIVISDSNIYIGNDRPLGNIIIFDKNGKYINQIQRGEGPEDILQLKGIGYDNILEELIVYHTQFLSFYTKEGKYKRRERIPLNAHSFALIPDGYLFFAVNGVDNKHLGYSETYQVFVMDKSFRMKSRAFPYRFSKNNNYSNQEHFRTNEYPIYISFNFIDTIYQYVDNQTIKANHFFDIRKKKIPESFLQTASIDDFFNLTEYNNYYYFTGLYVDTDTHIFIAYRNRFINLRSNFFIDKRTRNILAGTSLVYQTKDFPCLSSPIASIDSHFIAYIQPYNVIPNLIALDNSLISEEDVLKLKELKEDDNPVLIFYELKDF